MYPVAESFLFDVRGIFSMRALLPFAGLSLLLLAGSPAIAADADLKVTVTNGTDTAGTPQIRVRPAGHHDADVIASGGSNEDITVPSGTYDVEVSYDDGAASKIIWFDHLALIGKVVKSVDMGMPVASLRVTVLNGKDTGGDRGFNVRPQGQHNADVIVSGRSGDTVRLAAGTYSVDVRYNDGAANKTAWLDNLVLSGNVVKTVEMGVTVASLRVIILNGGKDTGGDRKFEVRPQGQHDADVIVSGSSGDTVRLAAGTYSVDVRFSDGAVNKTVWLDDLVLAGAVEKTVEMGAPGADVTWHILNHGQDLGSDAIYEIRPRGNHNADVIVSSTSGQSIRLPPGTYNVDITYTNGLFRKTIWLDNQTFAGKVDRTTDLALNLAHPTVTATLNGKDVGDAARIGIVISGQQGEVGEIQSGQTALVETGHFDFNATMPGAEGSLRAQNVAGQQHFVVAMKALQTAELTPNGPPPKACTIEVYGVNFDFNKSALRPESAPVLQAVQKLFTATPSFRAEVGGHTDNIGKPDYNLKLSEARAGAVKAWLVAHGVAADRVTSRGYGDTHPLVPNDTDANRFKNRRVELRRTNCQ
jgi:outer membrane protein OmpA-like peptidoglycan-associated protein